MAMLSAVVTKAIRSTDKSRSNIGTFSANEPAGITKPTKKNHSPRIMRRRSDRRWEKRGAARRA